MEDPKDSLLLSLSIMQLKRQWHPDHFMDQQTLLVLETILESMKGLELIEQRQPLLFSMTMITLQEEEEVHRVILMGDQRVAVLMEVLLTEDKTRIPIDHQDNQETTTTMMEMLWQDCQFTEDLDKTSLSSLLFQTRDSVAQEDYLDITPTPDPGVKPFTSVKRMEGCLASSVQTQPSSANNF